MRSGAAAGTWFLLLATAFVPGRCPAADDLTAAQKREGLHWPGEAGKRIKVSIGLYLVDFARINLREESFDLAGYLDTSWVDPGLALKPGEALGRDRRFRPGQVWAPALEFVNAVEQVNTEREGDLYVDDGGKVSQRVRFSHKFQSPLNLNRFPFDGQTLSILIAPFDPFAKDLDLVANSQAAGKLEGASVTDWEVGAVTARVDKRSGGEGEPRYVFDIAVSRRSTFYVWRVLLPITLLVITSWTVFWFEPVNLQPQISTGLAILLSLVTFTYAIDSSLPKVAYLTFIDRFSLAAFSFLLLVIFSVAIVHHKVKSKDLEGAMRFQARARVAFPVAFLAAIGWIGFLSFS